MRSSCRGRCTIENNCVSFNIGPPINDKVLCQLSNSDHIRHPDDLKPRDGFMYSGTEVRKWRLASLRYRYCSCDCKLFLFIIHQIFSLARDWSKCITWPNIREYFPIFKTARVGKEISRIKDVSSFGVKIHVCPDICPWTLSRQADFFYHQNPCFSNPCAENATCLNGFTDKKYVCVCQPGYTGEHCEKGEPKKDACSLNYS